MSLKALFIKSPFKYMELSEDTILAQKDLLSFDSFKRVVLALREEKGFHNSEADTLVHFCSFISGLAILSKKFYRNEFFTSISSIITRRDA